MGVRDWVESQLTLSRALLGATWGILAADIFIREGPVMGTYMTDLLAMALFLLMLYINRKLDKGHDELMLEIQNTKMFQEGYQSGIRMSTKQDDWVKGLMNAITKMVKERFDAESMDRPGEQEGLSESDRLDPRETTSDSGRGSETDPSGVHGLERIQ